MGLTAICSGILNGFDASCVLPKSKYYQNVILVNKSDVQDYVVRNDLTQTNIYFSLNSGKSGFLFKANEIGKIIAPKFSKSKKDNINYYSHSVQLPIFGIDESAKSNLKQLDRSNYFAVVQFTNNTVEVYGFQYGLKTNDYTYEDARAVIELTSKYDEVTPPLIYKPNVLDWQEQANTDFNNLFANIPSVLNGDFNNDFNNDFDI